MNTRSTHEEKAAIVRKWYALLGIDKKYEGELEAALAETEIDEGLDPIEYTKGGPTGRSALVQILFFCEGLAERYRKAGIPEEILLATLDDIRIYCEEWSAVKGELTTATTSWLSRHFGLELFRLGRLQFCMAPTRADYPARGIPKGEPILEVHIPRGDRMTPESCRDSFRAARVFFARYFPEYRYSYFTCNSWLLDETLAEFLPPESNIIRFGNLFERLSCAEGLYMLDYLYPIGTKVEDLPTVTPRTSLSKKIRDAILAGRKFYPAFGVIPADAFDGD